MLSLVQEGVVALDDTCEQWLPGVVPGATGITVLHLLNHTSGLYNYTEDLPDPKQIVHNRYRRWQPREAIEMANAHAPLFEPGTSWAYSNTNYILLGLLIEAVTGNPYAAELEARALSPLGLERTFAPGNGVTMPEPHAHGYFSVGGELVDITDLNASQAWAACEMVATADDLNRFYAGLLTGALLGSAELNHMLSTSDNGDYGLGIQRVQLPNGLVLWGDSGAIFGYFTGTYHSSDASRQVTFSYTSTGTELDTAGLLARIFTNEH